MSRYIDADALMDSIIEKWGVDPKYLDDSLDAMKDVRTLEWINSAPSIDLVFCEDCRYCVEQGVGVDCPSGYGYLYCKRMKSVVDEDFYCGWGERR